MTEPNYAFYPPPVNEVEVEACCILTKIDKQQYWCDYKYTRIDKGTKAISSFVRNYYKGKAIFGDYLDELSVLSFLVFHILHLEPLAFVAELQTIIEKEDRSTNRDALVKILIDHINEYEELAFNGEGRSLTSIDYPATGEFVLPWKFVDFRDGCIYLYHPNDKEKTNPFVFVTSDSKKAFNLLIVAFEKQAKHLLVRVEENTISRIVNYWDCKELVKVLDLSNQFPQLSYDQVLIKYRSFYDNRVISKGMRKGLNDSDYLRFLAEMQIPQFHIYFCKESVTHRTSHAYGNLEQAFLFVIDQCAGLYFLVYENENTRKCTYLFTVEEKDINSAIGCIIGFFSSNYQNKREALQLYDNLFKLSGVLRIDRILHTDFVYWKLNLLDKILLK